MVDKIKVGNKNFELFIKEEIISSQIRRVADEITEELKDSDPLFICVLTGAFMFASDLLKNIDFPCEVTFVRLKSYSGLNSSGQVKELGGLTENIEGRNVVVVEDIIDSGRTMDYLKKSLLFYHPASFHIATLLLKPDALQMDVHPDFVAMEVPNDFIVGFGLDYDGHGRNLRNIYKIKE